MKKDIECPSCSSINIPKEEQNLHRLSHWPIQIKLIGTVAPFLNNAELVVAADCTAFAADRFHERFLQGRKLLIGCPKLDDAQYYLEKFTEIFSNIPIKDITCVRMEVPCCGGMTVVLREALKRSRKTVPLKEVIVGVKGDLLVERNISLE